MLEGQVREDYVPKALQNKPVLFGYEHSVLQQYLTLAEMRSEGFNGIRPLTLREIDLHLTYYPVDDVFYFIDLMKQIDRLYRDGINVNGTD